MKFILNNSTDPWFNLALDEYLLENNPSDGPFFYLWRNRPSVIIGLNQNAYSEVNIGWIREHGVRLARRVTGGGAVYHDLNNLNYTFIGKGVTPEPFVQALRSLGVDATLTGRNDIFVDGRKVSGYARRVSHGNEIVHGTLMIDVDIDALANSLNVPGSKVESKGIASVRSRVANLKDYLPPDTTLETVRSRIHGFLADGDGEITLTEDMMAAVRKSAEEKFSTWEWIYGHSRQADIIKKQKLSCGTVEAAISLDRGIIQEIHFSGDFLGGLAVSALEDRLKGLRYERDSILEALASFPVSDCLDGVSPEGLVGLLTE